MIDVLMIGHERKGLRFAVLVLVLMLLGYTSIIGCSLDVNIKSLKPSIPQKMNRPGGSEFVSGSNQFESTLLRSYKINSSSGSFTPQLMTTTPRGYKVYSSVQGSLISDGGH